MTYLFVLIICLCYFLVICGATHARIGKYPDLKADGCGYGRESEAMDDSCFKWHKIDDSMSNIMNGREAMIGEVPYVIYINVEFIIGQTYVDSSGCTGSILNERMAVTAAHCFRSEKCDHVQCDMTIIVIFGLKNRTEINDVIVNSQLDDNIRFAGVISHPDFSTANYSRTDYKKQSADIAIVYWEDPIVWTKYEVNPICLPKSQIINNGLEYGMISGWGLTDPNNPNVTEEFLPMGWVQILPASNDQSDHNGDLVLAKFTPYPTGTVSCVGDSGGPLIQYVRGRAVLIGTIFGDLTYASSTHLCTYDDKSIMAFVRISKKIDWIINIAEFVSDLYNSTLTSSSTNNP